MPLSQRVVDRIPQRWLTALVEHAEALKFVVVGGICFVVTFALFFGLKLTVLHDKPVTANAIAVLVATVLSYVLNREWSFTERGGRQRHHEAALFFAVAGLGMAINQVPLYVTRYVLNLRTPHVSLVVENVADFVGTTIIGTLLAMVFRWWAMRRFVFPEDRREGLPESSKPVVAD